MTAFNPSPEDHNDADALDRALDGYVHGDPMALRGLEPELRWTVEAMFTLAATSGFRDDPAVLDRPGRFRPARLRSIHWQPLLLSAAALLLVVTSLVAAMRFGVLDREGAPTMQLGHGGVDDMGSVETTCSGGQPRRTLGDINRILQSEGTGYDPWTYTSEPAGFRDATPGVPLVRTDAYPATDAFRVFQQWMTCITSGDVLGQLSFQSEFMIRTGLQHTLTDMGLDPRAHLSLEELESVVATYNETNPLIPTLPNATSELISVDAVFDDQQWGPTQMEVEFRLLDNRTGARLPQRYSAVMVMQDLGWRIELLAMRPADTATPDA